MDTQGLLAASERGLHLLFDTRTVRAAFEQEAQRLRAVVDREIDSIQRVVQHLLRLPDASEGRDFIAALPRELQYVLVLLYFELLDGRLRKRPVTLH